MKLPVALVVCQSYPPFTGDDSAAAARWVQMLSRSGHRVEILAASDSDEEFTHLDAFGNLVHRIAPERSYASGLLGVQSDSATGFAVRATEKLLELRLLWNRTMPPLEAGLGGLALVAPAVAAALWPLMAGEETVRKHALAPPSVRSVDLVICTFDRLDELIVSIDSAIQELGEFAAKHGDIAARLRILYQNADLLDRLRKRRPDLLARREVSFELSQPPSLTVARNRAVADSTADLVVFIDDDVKLHPGFLAGYLEAADRHPDAIGFVGRIQSPAEPVLGQMRAMGQVRATGHVDVNFNTANREATFVPLTPMGANMAFRRERMNRLFGKTWFDSKLTGSAIREETTLALEIHRAGEYFVFVPDAALDHLEALSGGCHNREVRSPWERIQHRSLETLFLARLYQGVGLLHAASAARVAWREVSAAKGPRAKLSAAAIHLAGYVGARRRFKSAQGKQPLKLVPKTDEPTPALLSSLSA